VIWVCSESTSFSCLISRPVGIRLGLRNEGLPTSRTSHRREICPLDFVGRNAIPALRANGVETLTSDGVVSPDAQNVYRTLAKQGYDIVENAPKDEQSTPTFRWNLETLKKPVTPVRPAVPAPETLDITDALNEHQADWRKVITNQ